MDIYDYIITDAGSAGCALARGFTDKPAGRALSLEAGPPADKFCVPLRPANPADSAVFRPNFLTNDDDNRAMIAGANKIHEIMSTELAASRVIDTPPRRVSSAAAA